MPHAGRQALGRPRHDGDVEDGLVAAALQLPQDEHVVVLVHQMLARFPPPSRSWIVWFSTVETVLKESDAMI